jgi:hypothetical protein
MHFSHNNPFFPTIPPLTPMHRTPPPPSLFNNGNPRAGGSASVSKRILETHASLRSKGGGG